MDKRTHTEEEVIARLPQWESGPQTVLSWRVHVFAIAIGAVSLYIAIQIQNQEWDRRKDVYQKLTHASTLRKDSLKDFLLDENFRFVNAVAVPERYNDDRYEYIAVEADVTHEDLDTVVFVIDGVTVVHVSVWNTDWMSPLNAVREPRADPSLTILLSLPDILLMFILVYGVSLIRAAYSKGLFPLVAATTLFVYLALVAFRVSWIYKFFSTTTDYAN